MCDLKFCVNKCFRKNVRLCKVNFSGLNLVATRNL
jgi:hypothetical protein